jgi:hypothetical protein
MNPIQLESYRTVDERGGPEIQRGESLIGWYFHTFAPDQTVDRQGRVIGLEAHHYLCEVCSWTQDGVWHAVLVSPDAMADWHFYDTVTDWAQIGHAALSEAIQEFDARYFTRLADINVTSLAMMRVAARLVTPAAPRAIASPVAADAPHEPDARTSWYQRVMGWDGWRHGHRRQAETAIR